MTTEHDYRALVERIRARVGESVPSGARVLVVSRGDDALLRLPGCDASHFPQSKTGLYAGHHPRDGGEAVEHLLALRECGAEYLVVPATARWWLAYYSELRVELESRGERMIDDPETCVIFALTKRTAAPSRPPSQDELEAMRTGPQAGGLVRALLPEEAGVALVGPAAPKVDVGDRPCWRLPAPSPDVTVDEVLAQADAARRAGAAYIVLLHPDAAARQLDGRLRRRLVSSLRPVFSQRLTEALELAPTETGVRA